MQNKRISRTMAIVLALVMVLGMIPMGAAATESAEIVQWNVTLRDNLQANFYLSIPEVAAETATVNVSVGGAEAVSHNVSELAKDDNGYYCVSAYVAAAQMTDEIGVSIMIDGTESVSKTYTLAQYAATVLENSAMSKYHDLVLNMLNYGAMAQLYFNHNPDNLANAGYELENAPSVPLEQEDILIEGAVDGIEFYGATLLFQDRIAIRYYFSAPNGVDGYTFNANDKTQKVEAKGQQYYVQIDGFNPRDYINDVTLTVSDGASSQSITYSPMYYIARMYNKTSTPESLKNLLAAMYGYHVAAIELPDISPEELGYTRFTLKELGITDGTQSGNLVNNKLVETGLDMKYLDADVSYGATIDGSSGIKYGASAAGSWDGFKIGLVDTNTLSVVYTTTNLTLFTVTAAEVGLESFTQTFNLKLASKVSASEMEGRLDFTISMWINDQLVMDHLLVGDLTGMGDYVGILTWGGASVSVITQETPEEMGYTRYTMADLGYADGTYNGTAVRTAEVSGGIDGKYMDVDVTFEVTEDPYNGIKIANTGATSWDGLRVGLCGEDVLAVQHMVGGAPYIFKLTPAEAGVKTFTERFNLKIAVELTPVENAPDYTIVKISMWINDRLVKKNVSTGGISGIGNFAGLMTWHENSNVTIATPVIEEIPEETTPEETEPEATEPEATEPEVTEPEVTEPEVDLTPEELGYTRYTLVGLGVADGTYAALPVVGGEMTDGLNDKYLDVDVTFGGVAEASSGIKVATTTATSWDGIRIGLADGDKLTVRYTVSDQELKLFTPADVGLTSFSETFNLKVATKVVDSETEGAKDVTLTMWINDKLVINHMLIGGVSGIGNCAGVLSYNGASITIASKPSPEEMGYTKITMADLGYADGTYDGNAVRTAEVTDGMDGKYLDVDVAFGDVVDGSSGIKVGNTAVGSWDGIRIGLNSDGTLIVQPMGSVGTNYTLTAEEAGVNNFSETFNLKFAVNYTPIDDTWTNVTINMWINGQWVLKNVTTGGVKGIGNCAGMLTWNGATITVATPA